MKTDKGSFRSRKNQAGIYSVIFVLLVIALIVAVNLLFKLVPSSITKIDTSNDDLFVLSDQTKQIVENLEQDVDVYWICQYGGEDYYVENLLDQYRGRSPHLNIERLDPVVYPNFIAQYTDATVSDNSLLVVSGDKSRYISYSSIFYYGNFDASIGERTEGGTDEKFDGEGCLTSAIAFVTSLTDIPVVYAVTGHGEASLPDTYVSAMEKDNVELRSLSLLTVSAIPEDCGCLLILSPQSDISAAEKDILLDYLIAGGRLFLISDYTETEMPNLDAVMEYYGVYAVEGIVLENDSGHYLYGTPYYLLPTVSTHTITDPLIDGGYAAVMTLAFGIETSAYARSTVSVHPLFRTTYSSISKVAGSKMTTLEKEEGDIDGPFSVGVAITDLVAGNARADVRIVWLSSSAIVNDDINLQSSNANQETFLNAISWMCNNEASVSIRVKSTSVPHMTVSSADSMKLSILLIGVIPLAIAAFGVVTVIRRKRR